jgi:hypothetical protein
MAYRRGFDSIEQMNDALEHREVLASIEDTAELLAPRFSHP